MSLSLLHSKVKVQSHSPELPQPGAPSALGSGKGVFPLEPRLCKVYGAYLPSQLDGQGSAEQTQGPNQALPFLSILLSQLRFPAVFLQCSKGTHGGTLSVAQGCRGASQAPGRHNHHSEQAEHNLQHKANSPSTLKATSERENNRWETADCRNRAGREKRAAFTA